MKHYININKVKLLTLLSVISLSMASCGDFLLIEPKNFVTEDNFWNEKTDVDQMVRGVYVMMQDASYIQRCIVWGELRSDNITEGLNVTNNENLYRALKENLRANNSYTDWAQFYKVANAAQIVIERAPGVAEKDPTYTPSQVLATQAEMKALRALSLFYVVRAFKDCPYPTHAVQGEEDLEPMYAHDGDSIVRVLIADLEGCVQNAVKKYPADNGRDYNSNVNRITQSSIYAILCDLCLWNGDYDKVVRYADKVIDAKWEEFDRDWSGNVNMSSGGKPVRFLWENDTYAHLNGKHTGYPLYPCFQGSRYGSHYEDIFVTGNSFESVFELQFDTKDNGTGNSAIAALYGKMGSGSFEAGPLYALQDVVVDVYNKQYKVYDSQYDIRSYINTGGDDQFSKGYPMKYTSEEIQVDKDPGNTQMPWKAEYSSGTPDKRNWIFYRLTDVMLMQAEALVELAGDNLKNTDEEGNVTVDDNLNRAFSIVWTINRRSLLTPYYDSVDASAKSHLLSQSKYETKEAMRELVQKERRRELMFEGKRWFDLVRLCHRNGNSPDYVKRYVPSKGTSQGVVLFVNYESLFWPYNKRELKANPALSQKPFYGSADGEDKNYESSAKK